MSIEKQKNNVLRFEQKARFHYLKYQKLADRGNYIDALVALRAAAAKDPENTDYQMELAELYTELCCFDESNYIFFSLIAKEKGDPGDCVFGLGCNFFGLRDADKARECFTRYLEEFPEGMYTYEAQDFLDLMEYEEAEALEDDIPPGAYDIAEEGKDLLDQGEYEQAIRVLSTALQKYPDLLFIKNNLALAYYCCGETEKSQELTREVLAAEPENLHATCNKILFENSLGPGESWEDCIAALDRLVPEELDEKVKLALTYCELMEDERAYRILQTVLEEMPYDARTLFLMGASAANTGRYAEAFDYFMDMIKIDPENTIALYYKNLVQEVCDGKRESVRILYAYQVPMEEIRRRMAFINASLQKGTEELQRLWREDEVFSSLLVWGLSLGELSVKRAVLDIIGNFADKKAEGILRRYLLRRSEPDPAKNDALLALRRMGALQPYIAYISGKITEIRVGMVEDAKTRLYPSSQKVLERIIEGADILNAREIMPFALEIFGRYISAQKQAPLMRNTNAWAAAILYICLPRLSAGGEWTIERAAEAMEAKPESVKRCVALLRKVFPAKDEEK